jgi:riboflavin synthase
MFTGIIQAVGRVSRIVEKGGDVELVIAAEGLALGDVAIGDSIAVSGCCLTVTNKNRDSFSADVSRETLAVTTLASWRAEHRVNLEKALCAGQALGGHYVTGHVDGIGKVTRVAPDARSHRLEFEAPIELARYIAKKGSICVDGTSLTVNEVDGPGFSVNLIPHTLTATISGDYRPGTLVNLEVDIIARYLERLVAAERDLGVSR